MNTLEIFTDRIIEMQRWVSSQSPDTLKHPIVQNLLNDLLKVRQDLETLQVYQ